MTKIVIQTNSDFTPKGKRRARVVEVSGHMGRGRQLRWYVGSRLYRQLAVNLDNLNLSRRWVSAGAAA